MIPAMPSSTATQALAQQSPATSVPRQAWLLVVTRGISALGSSLTAFGLDVWVLRETGSYQAFAMLAVLSLLPSLLFAPFAGLLADRLDRRRALLGCEVVSLLVVCLVLGAHLAGRLNVPVVAVAVVVMSLASELRWATLGPLLSLIAPREHLGRLNGLQQSFRGVVVMAGPLLAAVGLQTMGLTLLLGVDALTFAVGVAGLLGLAVPPRAWSDTPYVFRNFWHELTYGVRWVLARPPLRTLLLFFTAVNVSVSIFTTSLAPYVLSRDSASVLGLILALQGAGMFMTGLLIARQRRRDGRSDDERRVLLGSLVFGAAMVAWGLSRHVALLCAVAVLVGAMTSLIMASSQTIWQTWVPEQIQGKVFAVRSVLAFGLAPLSILASVPLASGVFHPLLHHWPLASSLFGTGQGAALGLMASTFGAIMGGCVIALRLRGGFKFEQAVPPPAPAEPRRRAESGE